MKPYDNLAKRFCSSGLCTSRISTRPTVHIIPSHDIKTPSRSVSYALRINRSAVSPQIRAKLGPIHQHQLQPFTIRKNSSMPSAKFSPGSEGQATEAALTNLLAEGGGRWTLAADGQGIERNFKFKTFTKTWVCSKITTDIRPNRSLHRIAHPKSYIYHVLVVYFALVLFHRRPLPLIH